MQTRQLRRSPQALSAPPHLARPRDGFGLVGTILDGKVRVEEQVGEGGFGVVYRGHHLAFDQPVAIKCLKVPAHLNGEARRAFIDRFTEEGRILFRLSEHRAIVRVFDCAVAELRGREVPYLILEWLDGLSLREHLRQRRQRGLPPMEEASALSLLREAIAGLAFAHQLRVVHRDIKPENLFLARTAHGLVTKLLDFGVAELMEEGEVEAPSSGDEPSSLDGLCAFSPQYAAPEQFSSTYGSTGPWTDVHAIGLVLTELVSPGPALAGEGLDELCVQSTAEARPTPRRRGATVSARLEAVCGRALALDPRQRYATAGELLRAVDACGGAPGRGDADVDSLLAGVDSLLVSSGLALAAAGLALAASSWFNAT